MLALNLDREVRKLSARPQKSRLLTCLREADPERLRSVLIVMVIGFTCLMGITALAYRNAPPIPGKVVDADGATVFTGQDVSNGQAVFLRYGLMDNGTVWGHGAYLGPDYSAETLHRIGEDIATTLAQQQYGNEQRRLSGAGIFIDMHTAKDVPVHVYRLNNIRAIA